MEKKVFIDVNKPYIYLGKVVFVHEGNVYDAAVDVGFRIFHRVRIKLESFEVPYIRSSNEDERNIAYSAKTCAMKMLLGRSVIMQTFKSSTYDRWSANLYIREDTKYSQTKATICGISVVDAAKYLKHLAEFQFDPNLVDISKVLEIG